MAGSSGAGRHRGPAEQFDPAAARPRPACAANRAVMPRRPADQDHHRVPVQAERRGLRRTVTGRPGAGAAEQAESTLVQLESVPTGSGCPGPGGRCRSSRSTTGSRSTSVSSAISPSATASSAVPASSSTTSGDRVRVLTGDGTERTRADRRPGPRSDARQPRRTRAGQPGTSRRRRQEHVGTRSRTAARRHSWSAGRPPVYDVAPRPSRSSATSCPSCAVTDAAANSPSVDGRRAWPAAERQPPPSSEPLRAGDAPVPDACEHSINGAASQPHPVPAPCGTRRRRLGRRSEPSAGRGPRWLRVRSMSAASRPQRASRRCPPRYGPWPAPPARRRRAGRRPSVDAEAGGQFTGDLGAFDRVDAEVGFEVEIGLDHVHRVAGALADDSQDRGQHRSSVVRGCGRAQARRPVRSRWPVRRRVRSVADGGRGDRAGSGSAWPGWRTGAGAMAGTGSGAESRLRAAEPAVPK